MSDGLPIPRSTQRARYVCVQVVAFTIAANPMVAPAVAGTPIDLSADPPTAHVDSGPSLSLGRVGPCPGCPTEPNTGLYNTRYPKY